MIISLEKSCAKSFLIFKKQKKKPLRKVNIFIWFNLNKVLNVKIIKIHWKVFHNSKLYLDKRMCNKWQLNLSMIERKDYCSLGYFCICKISQFCSRKTNSRPFSIHVWWQPVMLDIKLKKCSRLFCVWLQIWRLWLIPCSA